MSDSKQLDLLPSLDLSSLEGWLLKEKTKPSRYGCPPSSMMCWLMFGVFVL
jgi:hypothetical protein